ncbi:MAG: hypothetical protein ACQEP5_05585 [Actinomycetota bacterium]
MNEIINLLKQQGPLTGKELIEKSRADALSVWRFCNISKRIGIKTIGRRFLRLDKHIEGYARLSPSILREFLTYTVAGLESDDKSINLKAESLHKSINKISSAKFELAKSTVNQIVASQKKSGEIEEKAAFIIAGDVVYNMAHSETRPEISTGEIIRGSDLDIIIVTKNLPGPVIRELDDTVYSQKYYLIKNPAYKEEIDYIIKDLAKVEEQLGFDSFEFMVASKILEEGQYLCGSKDLFREIKGMLLKKRIPEKLKCLENNAIQERKKAQQYLLNPESSLSNDEYSRLFFTKEETDEIF